MASTSPLQFHSSCIAGNSSLAHFDAQKSIPARLLHPTRDATTVDVHGSKSHLRLGCTDLNTLTLIAHHVPNWFRTIEPSDGGLASPVVNYGVDMNLLTLWTLELQLQHMANQSIGRSILSIPKPNIFPGDRNATMAIARLLNENSAALVKALPQRFSFFATSALPYVDETIAEIKYAVETLGAVGVALTSNHEGKYLGNPEFIPFFARMETMNGALLTIIFVHPANPLLETAGTLVLANPTSHLLPTLTHVTYVARTFMDLALSSTLQNLTHVNFIVPHVGGSLPSIIDRTITGRANPNDTTAIMEAFHTRCWWDSAGITYAHQLGGLLAYNISPSFLLYGSDYPWIPAPLVDPAFDAIATSPFLDDAQKQAMRSENIKRLFKGKIEF
ncbi:amidohydrolase 2 [Mycena leptocephala]|nr:amidohydrolase 2 [Mycena leptocephala]